MKNNVQMALLTVEGFSEPPSLETIAIQLAVAPEDIDRSFGVVLVDPKRGMYCIQIRADRLTTESNRTVSYDGPWAAPPIDTFRLPPTSP